ncbi:MAG: hypothetical protein JHC88_14650 [Niveispirillum sp.]|nr:hypothetical protein [Niveispirillum sp.]
MDGICTSAVHKPKNRPNKKASRQNRLAFIFRKLKTYLVERGWIPVLTPPGGDSSLNSGRAALLARSFLLWGGVYAALAKPVTIKIQSMLGPHKNAAASVAALSRLHASNRLHAMAAWLSDGG